MESTRCALTFPPDAEPSGTERFPLPVSGQRLLTVAKALAMAGRGPVAAGGRPASGEGAARHGAYTEEADVVERE